ncbi:ParB/RepB/Spo0J family partition protein [Streptococcus sp. 21WXBC0057M1]|uniref:ParB/RepB/Spo0J family partition protein n=1 Tax=Streptococcus wuxiensis TaxID=3095078 RepID=A0ABU5FXD8_9STRE|nr:ParB/RepB/Spo0J family partition protein [Streptococcus sp. 21WXBC0057M1]MDY4337771.1 ParB/RepB/Spo0J family partition protein [Streptococcus sp. 21WXBC0057M1]
MEELKLIRISDIQKNPYQPRKEFSKEKIQELAQSIKENGLIQPIIVRQSPVIGYEILAGERRYRASIEAGLSEVPVIIKKLSDQDMMVHSIIENLQREDLNPIEEAKAYQSLIDKGYTHADIAEKMGKSRPYITNLVRLLTLPDFILKEVETGKLSQAHARLLIQLPLKEQKKLLNRIQKEDLSVRQVEYLLKEEKNKKKSKEKDHFIKEEEENLKKLLGLDVQIVLQKKEAGKITISFHNQEEYQRFINSLK